MDLFTQAYTGAIASGADQREPTFTGELKNALPRGLGQMVQGVGQLVEDYTPWEDNFIKRYGERVVERNPTQINSLEDIAEHPAAALGSALGNAASFVGPGLGLKGLMALRGIGTAGQFAGQTALAGMPSYGGIREQQLTEGHDLLSNKLTALGGAAAVGAIEQLGVQRMLGINPLKRTGQRALVGEFGATPWRTAFKTMGRSTLEEGAEELAQNPIEQMAAYRDPRTPEAIDETLFGGAMGALGGLGFGGGIGGYRGLQHRAMRDQLRSEGYVDPTGGTPTDLLRGMEERDYQNYLTPFRAEAARFNQMRDEPEAFLPEGAMPTRGLMAEDINANLGVRDISKQEHKQRQTEYSKMFNAGSGVFVVDPQTQQERELSLGEWHQISQLEVPRQQTTGGLNLPPITNLAEAVELLDFAHNAQVRNQPVEVGSELHQRVLEAQALIDSMGIRTRYGEPFVYRGQNKVNPNVKTQIREAAWLNTEQRQKEKKDEAPKAKKPSAVDKLVEEIDSRATAGLITQNERDQAVTELRDAEAKVQAIPKGQRGNARKEIIVPALKKWGGFVATKLKGASNANGQSVRAGGTAKNPEGKNVSGGKAQVGASAQGAQAPGVETTQTQQGEVNGTQTAKGALPAVQEEARQGQAVPDESVARFDNRPEFTDWALKRVGADEKLAEAYKRWKAIGEFSGTAPASFDALRPLLVNAKTGKPYSHVTVKKRMEALDAQVTPLEQEHLFAPAEDVDTNENAPGEVIDPTEAVAEKSDIQEAAETQKAEDDLTADEAEVVEYAKAAKSAVGAGAATQKVRGLWAKLVKQHGGVQWGFLPKEYQQIFSDRVVSEDVSGRDDREAQKTHVAEVLDTFNGLQKALREKPELVQQPKKEGEKKARVVKELAEKDTLPEDLARYDELLPKVVGGDFDAAVELVKLLGSGANGQKLFRKLADSFRFPGSVDTPAKAVEYLISMVKKSSAPETAPKATNEFEKRIAGLAGQVGEKQQARINKLVAKLQKGEIDAERFSDELATVEDQVSKGIKYSEAKKLKNPTTAKMLHRVLDALFMSPARKNQIVRIYATQAEAFAALGDAAFSGTASLKKGFTLSEAQAKETDHPPIGLIAENIPEGQELSIMLHELGVHLGMERLVGAANMKWLADRIEAWRQKNDNSVEARVAKWAYDQAIKSESATEDRQEELIAYTVEGLVRSGIIPQALDQTEAHQWFRKLWAAAKAALRKLGFKNPNFSGQNLVDLAYGAADLELQGAWHGTAADFRNFNHDFMGAGEGNQAFGWGTYLAQRVGISKGYWKTDVERKGGGQKPELRNYRRLNELRNASEVEDHLGFDRLAQVTGVAQLHYNEHKTPEKAVRAMAAEYDMSERLKSELRIYLRWKNARIEEGSLMRVAVNVRDDEFLDLDKALYEQSDTVKDAFADGTKSKILRAIAEDPNSMWWSISGDDLYRALEKEFVSDEQASKYLDSIGIKGNKFLDSQSRSLRTDYNSFPKAKELFAAAKADDYLGFDTYGQVLNAAVQDGMDAMRTNFNDMSPALSTVLSEFMDWLKTSTPQTHNLVIFNDKNVQRVSTQVGARRDSGSIKFADTVKTETVTYNNPYLYKQDAAVRKRNGQQVTSEAKLPSGQIEVTWATKSKTKFSESAPAVAATQEELITRANTTGNSLWQYVKDNAEDLYKRGLTALVFGHDLERIAKSEGLATAEGFFKLGQQKDAIRNRIETQAERVLEQADKLKDREAADDFLRNSTVSRKWGFAPEWDTTAVIDPQMKKQFDALSPEAQEVVKQVFKFGNDTYTTMRDELSAEITQEYDALIAANTGDAQAKLIKDRANAVKQMEKLMPKSRGPYAPLRRFGDYVFVGKSKAYVEAENAKDTKRMNELIADEKNAHYVVEFYENIGQARAREREIGHLFYEPTATVRQKMFHGVDTIPWAGLQSMKQAISESKDERYKTAMQRIVTELYLQTVAETSARKAEIARKGTKDRAGVLGSDDMFRGFAASAQSTAQYVASLTNNKKIVQQIAAMREEAHEKPDGESRHKATRVYNEIMARYAQSLDYRPTPYVDKAMRVASIWMLMTSPAYYLQNSLQPFMFSQPYMAGKFGMDRTFKALTNAYKQSAKYIKNMGAELDIDAMPLSVKEKEALRSLWNDGKLDIGINAELGRWKTNKAHDVPVLTPVMRGLDKAMLQVETLNRVTTAIAAHRLSGGDMNYVAEVLDKTHGNYAKSNAPRFFHANSISKLMTQFKKYQLIQVSLLVGTVHKAFKDADPNERAVARRLMGWLLAQHLVMVGVAGTIPTALLMLAGALGGDDDKDWERNARKMIGNDDLATLILRGLPAYVGLDLSKKLGITNAFSLLPFTDVPKDRTGFEKAVTSLSGAFIGGLGGQLFDAIGQFGSGNYYKGIELLLPRGVRDGMRGYRYFTEGVTTKRGDVQLAPDEISLVDAISQAVGLPSTTITDFQRQRGDIYELNQRFKDREQSLRDDFVAARKESTEAAAKVREEFMELQEAKKRWLAEMSRQGFIDKQLLKDLQPHSPSLLFKAVGTQAKREKQWARATTPT